MTQDGGQSEAVQLVQSEDYYLDHGLVVLTARYHLRRGYCCEQGCRHCPYEDSANSNTDAKSDDTIG